MDDKLPMPDKLNSQLQSDSFFPSAEDSNTSSDPTKISKLPHTINNLNATPLNSLNRQSLGGNQKQGGHQDHTIDESPLTKESKRNTNEGKSPKPTSRVSRKRHYAVNAKLFETPHSNSNTNKRSADGQSIVAKGDQIGEYIPPVQPQEPHEWQQPSNSLAVAAEVSANDSLSDLLGYSTVDNDGPNLNLSSEPVLSLDQISTVYDLEQFLSSLINRDVSFNFLVTPPPMVKPFLWTFLQVRRLAKDLNWLVVALYHDGCASNQDCQKSLHIGSREVYCGSHPQPKHCLPIEYSWHTLDWAMDLLSLKTLNLENQLSAMIPSISHREVAIAYKRMFTIFEHAWYNHQAMFEKFEKVLKLYQRALAVGLNSKMLKPHTPLIPFHAYMEEESVIEEIGEYDYIRELDCIIQMTTMK